MLVDTKSHNAQLDVTRRVFFPPSPCLSPSLSLALPVSFWWGPINFIAHLIDRKNYSFISTKIAKSAQNQRNDAVGPLSVESEMKERK